MLAAIGVAAVVALVVLAMGLGRDRVELRIATAGRGGTYFPLGESIADILDAELGDSVRAEAIETAGSIDNVARLEAGEDELASVQNDTPAGHVIRTIAPLYDEVMQTVVRDGVGIDRLEELRGHVVSIGAEGSGTAILAQRLLEHFGATDGTTIRHLSTMEG